jgi:hypothetical protein
MPRALLTLLAALALAACAERPLTEAERAFTGTVMGPALEADDVRLVQGSASNLLKAMVPVRPRTTCRERIYPPRSTPVPGSFPAMAIGQSVYFARDLWSEDFLSDYPQAMELTDAMRLAHELTHVWQWQRRDLTGYHPYKASLEHAELDDPYLLEIDPARGFLDYGFEQQGVIVEEFVCCRALDPEGARTESLHRLVAEVFPAAARRDPAASGAISLPWAGAETRGICS